MKETTRGELLHKNATITWKTPKKEITMNNVDIWIEEKAYRLYYEENRGNEVWTTSKRVWKKNVLKINEKEVR